MSKNTTLVLYNMELWFLAQQLPKKSGERGNNGATDKLLFGLKECLKHSRGLFCPVLSSPRAGQTD